MLQHNVHQRAQRAPGDTAHWAHAAVVSLHAICCGLPVLAMVLATGATAGSGWAAFAASSSSLHDLLHAQELWVLAVSGALVAIGGGFELVSRRGGADRGIPWLFLLSAACLALNLAIMVVHRG